MSASRPCQQADVRSVFEFSAGSPLPISNSYHAAVNVTLTPLLLWGRAGPCPRSSMYLSSPVPLPLNRSFPGWWVSLGVHFLSDVPALTTGICHVVPAVPGSLHTCPLRGAMGQIIFFNCPDSEDSLPAAGLEPASGGSLHISDFYFLLVLMLLSISTPCLPCPFPPWSPPPFPLRQPFQLLLAGFPLEISAVLKAVSWLGLTSHQEFLAPTSAGLYSSSCPSREHLNVSLDRPLSSSQWAGTQSLSQPAIVIFTPFCSH